MDRVYKCSGCEGTKHKEFMKDNTRPFRMELITIDEKIEFRKEYI